jgi:acyl carrier protein
MDRSIKGRVIYRLLKDELDLAINSVSDELLETGILDSLSIVELILLIEKEFEIMIDPADLEIDDFRTIARIDEMVLRQIEAQRIVTP